MKNDENKDLQFQIEVNKDNQNELSNKLLNTKNKKKVLKEFLK